MVKESILPMGFHGKLLEAGFVQDSETKDIICLETGEIIPYLEYTEWQNATKDPDHERDGIEYALNGKPSSLAKVIGDVQEQLLSLATLEDNACLVKEINNPDQEIGETDTGHWETPVKLSPDRNKKRIKAGVEVRAKVEEDINNRHFEYGAGCDNKIHPEFVEREMIEAGTLKGIRDFCHSVYTIFEQLKQNSVHLQFHIPDFEGLSSLMGFWVNKINLIDPFGLETSSRDFLSIFKEKFQEVESLKSKLKSSAREIKKLRFKIYSKNRKFHQHP